MDDGIIPTAKGYRLTEDDHIRHDVIMRLMCNFELDFKSVEDAFNIKFKEYFKWGLSNLKEMEGDDLIIMNDDGIIVKDTGRLLIRNIAINFDGYIERKEDKAKYSRTV